MTEENKVETKATETATPETKNTVSENRIVFGPLGKYAVIAVIMVSVIVTTAIMLDKELNTVDEQLAVIENEVAGINTVATESPEDTSTVSEITETVVVSESAPEVVTAVETAAAPAEEVVAAESSAEVTKTEEAAVAEQTEANSQAVAADASVLVEQSAETTPAEQAVADHQAEFDARVAANRSEQKQRLTEAFDRINALEEAQLQAYKADQEEQIKRLREKLADKQEMIDALILRNQELYQMREATFQRSQENRVEILNRI